MALRAGYYGIKRGLKAKLADIAGAWDQTVATIFPRSEQAILGAKNQLNTSLSVLKALNTTGTWADNVYTISGVSFTVSADGSITITSQAPATAHVYFDLNTNFNTTKYSGWILNGLPVDGGPTTFRYRICASPDNRAEIQDFNLAAGRPINDNGTGKCLCIRIASGYNPNGIVIKPMVSIDGGAFVPYAMTNRELTVSAADQASVLSDHKTEINAIISAATGAADFAAFKTAMEALTPLTRSIPSGSDQRSLQDITPEVEPEEKEAEEASEPATKKRSTKKTVKEGE